MKNIVTLKGITDPIRKKDKKEIMQGIEIIATGRSLPVRSVTNQELSKIVDTSDQWIRTRTGIGSRYYCEEETTASMAIEAAKKAVQKAKINKQEIGIVVVATTTPEYAFPSTACLVQQALELPEEVMAFDINAACAGFLYGLGIIAPMLQNSRKPYALVIGSEHLSKIVNYQDRGSCILFGDGAGAALIKKSEKDFYHKGYTRGNKECLYCNGLSSKKEDFYLHMEGNQVFRFAVSAIEEGIESVLKEAKLTMKEVDIVLCHQANGRIISHVEKKYKEYPALFYKNIEFYGNTSAASIPIALDEMGEKGLLKEGQKLLMVGFGAGFTWSSCLLTI